MSIKSDTIKIKGKLSFMHLVNPDDFGGKGAPKYKFRLTNLSDAAEAALTERFGEDAGLGHKRVKFNSDYPDAGKYAGFSSNFPIKVKYEGRTLIDKGRDVNGNEVAAVLDPIAENIGYGSEAVVALFADTNGNPRVSFVDIKDLVTFDADADESSEDYDDDEVL